MSFSAWVALAAVIATIYGLIKRYETRLVLLLAGLVMCCCSLDPMAAFEQFDKSMTNRALIISICSSMGFAACVTLRKLCKIRNFSQSPFGGFIFEESDGNFPSGRN